MVKLMSNLILLGSLLFLSTLPSVLIAISRSFVIDYANDQFSKDGRWYRFISGSIHYFRIPAEYWHDRLIKSKWAGLNAVASYVPWNMHEPQLGTFDFSGNLNLTEFLQSAQRNGLDVILRMGPYVCSELDNGGLPWWLLKMEPDMRARSSDPRYLNYVLKWFSVLLPTIVPFLYKNGGPVIMIQVENEYGSYYACDRAYMTYLRDLVKRYVGDDVVLFTVDGGTLTHLRCGYTPGLYPTVDFGVGDRGLINSAFSAQRAYTPRGPLVNMEFYSGWLDVWGYNHSTVNTASILSTMLYMYEKGASFNLYMFHGGSTWGYWNGAVGNGSCTTSYDYDAPLDETGDPTYKYTQIKMQIEHLTGIRNTYTTPTTRPKRSYGPMESTRMGSVIDFLPMWNDKKMNGMYPLTFEELDWGFGYVLYETVLPWGENGGMLFVGGLRDRGYVMVQGEMQGILSSPHRIYQINIKGRIGDKLQILVENSGRATLGPPERKGISSMVTLDGRVLSNWTMYPIRMDRLMSSLKWDQSRIGRNTNSIYNTYIPSFLPSIYYSQFYLDGQLEDTFFHPGGWGRGQLFVNDFNVGKYWPALGPQVTLYVPKTMLKVGWNYVLMLELEKAGNCRDWNMRQCSFSFVDYAILNKVVSDNHRTV